MKNSQWMKGVQRMLSVLALARPSTLALLTPSDELAKYRAARRAGRWVEKWPNGQAQQGVVSGTKSSWRTDRHFPCVDMRAKII